MYFYTKFDLSCVHVLECKNLRILSPAIQIPYASFQHVLVPGKPHMLLHRLIYDILCRITKSKRFLTRQKISHILQPTTNRASRNNDTKKTHSLLLKVICFGTSTRNPSKELVELRKRTGRRAGGGCGSGSVAEIRSFPAADLLVEAMEAAERRREHRVLAFTRPLLRRWLFFLSVFFSPDIAAAF